MEKISEREGEGSKTAEEARTRIYVGGLGANVTEDEIRKTFSGLGGVESVDIYRTKGRSFAYIDFLPSNHKSLPKLFSTYNGCMWKGGRLKLEKAKEHYLLRLKREWEKDAKLARSLPINDVDASESMPSLEKPKKLLTSEKPHLRLFFPKLNKMKSVPFSGSGKHKYSFQRITVPSLPINFCDCEEHYDSSQLEKERPSFDLETVDGGIKEEELNMMESVMNKLFEKETHPTAVSSEAQSTEEEDYSVNENVSDPPSDEDNLIINMVAGGNEIRPVSGSRRQKTITTNQEPTHGVSKASKEWTARKLHEIQKNKIEPYAKKRKSPFSDASNGNELGSLETKRKRSSNIQGGQTTEPESCIQQSTSNFSWSQKSAWKDLVGKRGDTPFQISHIVPSIPSAEEEQPQISNFVPGIPSAKEDQPQISHIVPSIPSAKEDQPQISHIVPGIPSAKEDDVNVSNITTIENQCLLKHEDPESEFAQSKDLQGAKAPSALPSDISIKSARGASWLQKSSWTQLIGNANTSSFSISQVLPGLTFEKQELQKHNGIDAASSRDVEQQDLFKLDTGHGVQDLKLKNKYIEAAPTNSEAIALPKNTNCPESEQTTTEEKQQTVAENYEVAAPKLGDRQPSRRKQISVRDFGETCSFMRNADSVKEWAKAKAALSGSLKKKVDEK